MTASVAIEWKHRNIELVMDLLNLTDQILYCYKMARFVIERQKNVKKKFGSNGETLPLVTRDRRFIPRQEKC